MSRQIKTDYSKIFLLPPSIEDWVGSDHPARFIREFVELLDMKDLGFKTEDNEEGRPYYSSELLIKIWLYGYYSRIRSSRELEKMTYENQPMIWLATMEKPDHNTIWRFWQRNKRSIKKLFGETVKTAIKLNLVSFVLTAVDGTKLKSLSANKWLLNEAEIEQLLKRIDKSISNLEKEIEKTEREERNYDDRLPKDLQDRETLREKIRKAREELKANERTKINIQEPEARIMRTMGGKRDTGYNGQAAVDSKERIIVGEELINEENDLHMLVPMIEKVKATTGITPARTVADQGYGSGEQLSEAEKRGYEVLTNLKKPDTDNPYSTDRFKYSSDKDILICPEGKELKYENSSFYHKSRAIVKRYKCISYKDCKVRWLCSKDVNGRRVKVTPYIDAINRQRKQHEIEENKRTLKKRKEIVETVFGWIKNIDNFRRFTVKGLENSKVQWSMICATINLRTIYKNWSKNKPIHQFYPCYALRF